MKHVDKQRAVQRFWEMAKQNKFNPQAFHEAFDKEIHDAEMEGLFDENGMLKSRASYKAINQMPREKGLGSALRELWALQFANNADVVCDEDCADTPLTEDVDEGPTSDEENRLSEIAAERKKLQDELNQIGADEQHKRLEARKKELMDQYWERRKLMFTSHDDPEKREKVDAELHEVEAELNTWQERDFKPRLDRIAELDKEQAEIRDAIKQRRLAKAAEKNERPDEDEWDEFQIEYFPAELDFPNMWIEVEDPDFGEGELTGYTYNIEHIDLEEVKKVASAYLKKPVREILCSDLFSIDHHDFEWMLHDYFDDAAFEQFKKDWDDGKIDSEHVAWYEPELTESFADYDAIKQFYNGLKANPAYLDVKAFHRACDDSLKAEDLSGLFNGSGLLVHRGTYGKIKECQDQELGRALKKFWAAQFVDLLKTKGELDAIAARKAEAEAKEAARKAKRAEVEDAVNQMIAEVSSDLVERIHAKEPELLDDYMAMIGATNPSEMFSMKPEILTNIFKGDEKVHGYIDCKLAAYDKGGKAVQADEQAADNIVDAFISLLREASSVVAAQRIDDNLAGLVASLGINNEHWNNLYFVDKDSDTVYKVSKEGGWNPKRTMQWCEAGNDNYRDVPLKEHPALAELQLVAADDVITDYSNSRGTYFHRVTNKYYDPEIDSAIGKSCGISFKEVPAQVFDNGISFLDAAEIPASFRSLGLARGERHAQELDSGD